MRLGSVHYTYMTGTSDLWTWGAGLFWRRATSKHRRCPLFTSYILLVPLLLQPEVKAQGGQAGPDGPTAAVITIKAPLDELMRGYLLWMHRHPEVRRQAQLASPPAPESSNSNLEAGPLLVEMPSIDLYSPLGISLYHGTESEENAAFIRALPDGIQHRRAPKQTNEVRPTLREAMEMFAEFKPYEAAPPAKKEYTVFALTYPGTPFCKAQNDAIQQLKNRARRTGICVIEVRLHK